MKPMDVASIYYQIPENERKGLKVSYKLDGSEEEIFSEIIDFGWKGYPFCENVILVKHKVYAGIFISAQSLLSISN